MQTNHNKGPVVQRPAAHRKRAGKKPFKIEYMMPAFPGFAGYGWATHGRYATETQMCQAFESAVAGQIGKAWPNRFRMVYPDGHCVEGV